jgi:hypothetical protein
VNLVGKLTEEVRKEAQKKMMKKMRGEIQRRHRIGESGA